MANKISIGTQGGVYPVGASATTYILKGTDYISSQSNGIAEANIYHGNTFNIAGSIYAPTSGVYGINSQGEQTTVNISASGIIEASSGIDARGNDFKMLNNGMISGHVLGVYLEGDNAQATNNGSIFGTMTGILATGSNAMITNHGLVQGDYAVDLGGPEASFVNDGTIAGRIFAIDADGLDIVNASTGVISSGSSAIRVNSKMGEHAHITNAGAIHGTEFAVDLGDGNERFVNTGTITGAISLGGGNDVFDNRGGKIISMISSGTGHDIAGGDGSDTYILDSRITLIENSGQGTDTVKSSITFNFSTGVYAGKELENLTLIGNRNISATGNELDNVVKGNIGDNHLSGAAGTDNLTGGRGADVFVFSTGFGKDTITDFGRGGDRVDLSDLSGVTSFSDLMKHHVTVSGSDLIITDGSDSLIFQNTEKSDFHSVDFIF